MIGKAYYVHETNFKNGNLYLPGVQQKIDQQIDILNTIYETEEVVLELSESGVAKRIPFSSRMYDWTEFGKISNPHLIYIRRPGIDRGFENHIMKAHKQYPETKILLEIPSYPYDNEIYKGVWKNYPLYLKDKYYRQKYYKYIDRIVTYTNDKEIFGVPTINIQNGIDVSGFPIRKPSENEEEIHLIAVASFQKYHGYERIINGMANYYQNAGKRRIIFDMVGDGTELTYYKQEVERLSLQSNVVFWGIKRGEELTEIFNKADIGMGSFGFYKIGLEVASSLKLREYIARGLPVVGGSKQDLFSEESFPYYLEFENNEKPLDIQRIIDFYDRIYNSNNTTMEIIAQIRTFAEDNITWRKTFQPVLDYLQS